MVLLVQIARSSGLYVPIYKQTNVILRLSVLNRWFLSKMNLTRSVLLCCFLLDDEGGMRLRQKLAFNATYFNFQLFLGIEHCVYVLTISVPAS